MRQRDQIEGAAIAVHRECAADDLIKLLDNHELRDCEFADRDQQLRTQKLHFVVQPGGAIANLIGRWDTVSTRGGFAGKTTTHRREVDAVAHFRFRHSAKIAEPTEERLAGGPGKGTGEYRLFHAGRLPDQNYFAENGSAGDWRRQHARAAPALPELCDMLNKR